MSGRKSSSIPRVAYVYSGDGAGHRSVLSTIESLKTSLEGIQVRQLNGPDLLQGDWTTNCVLLCLPGGADLPYCKLLNGKGNTLIREYVEKGGSYLGLCAGAYYACSRIDFERGTPLEVEGKRELAFFPGVGKGAVFSGFEYETEAGTHAAPIQFKEYERSQWTDCKDYSNGGPQFLREDGADDGEDGVSNLALYSGTGLGPAAVKCQVGNGAAILCGTHPELNMWWLDPSCDYDSMRRAHPKLSDSEVERLVKHAEFVQGQLYKDQDQRETFWRMLLSEANLHHCLRPVTEN